MEMDDIAAVIADLGNHAGAQRSRGQHEACGDPGNANTIQHFVGRIGITAGYNYAQIYIVAKPTAKSLHMGLDSTHVGRVKLAHVKDLQSAPIGPASV
jgi:hypothetical protein